jgi:hypothetical protein
MATLSIPNDATSRSEYNALYFAFSRVFTDLVRRGYIEGDQDTLDEFWRAFVADMTRFPNAWGRARMN